LPLLSSNLLEAEIRPALNPEGFGFHVDYLADIDRVLPDRPLTPESKIVLAVGHHRRVGLWHLATALYLAQDPTQIVFITLDVRQQAIVESLGFQTGTAIPAHSPHQGQVRLLSGRW
jgi:hypothetical protein